MLHLVPFELYQHLILRRFLRDFLSCGLSFLAQPLSSIHSPIIIPGNYLSRIVNKFSSRIAKMALPISKSHSLVVPVIYSLDPSMEFLVIKLIFE